MKKNYNQIRKTKANITQVGGKITISSLFAGAIKKGIEPDENGWYKVWGGAFNAKNFGGDDYPLTPKLKAELTSEGSQFNLRMANGLIGGECNHPDLHLLPTDQAKMLRLRRIDKTRECLQVMKMEMDSDTYVNDDGSPVTAFWLWIKPTGEYGPALERSLRDPDIQVVLSIRTESINTLRPNMTWQRVVTAIAAVDWVDVQGMAGATKFESLQYSMEDLSDARPNLMFCHDELEVTPTTIQMAEEELVMMGMSTEDVGQDLANLKAMLSEVAAPLPESNRAYSF